MATIRGNFFNFLARKAFNMNPEIHPTMDAMTALAEKGNKGKTNKGFERKVLTTPSGTKFEQFSKIGSPKTGKLVLYFHGGGYLTGLTDQYRQMAKDFFNHFGGAETIMLDYDLAPEKKYPVQKNQAMDMWNYIVNELGYKEENIALGGDSAGGNLSLCLQLMLRDEGRKLPCAYFGISPWADMTARGDSYIFNYSNDVLFGLKGSSMLPEKEDTLLNCPIYTFVGENDRYNPYVSPVYGEYNGFPPTLITVGSHEMLLSDSITIYRKMLKEGIPVELEVGDDMFHIYPLFHTFMPEAKKAYKRIMTFLEKNCK